MMNSEPNLAFGSRPVDLGVTVALTKVDSSVEKRL